MPTLVHNIGTLVTLEKVSKKKGKKIVKTDLSLKTNASFLIDNGFITEINPKTIPENCNKIDAQGCAVLPGFVDAHTHLVFAGNRASEFELRSEGKTYQEIHKKGGGILATVEKTRNASQEELFKAALHFLHQAKENGTTTIEIKSGYGLTTKDEIKILRVIKKLREEKILTIVPTFLGAHTIPKEYKSNPQKYVEILRQETLPQVADENLAEFCDIFIEKGSFSLKQAEKILDKAVSLDLKIRVHADQFSSFGATSLALEYGTTSIDHLEHISSKNIKAMAQSKTTATLLPGVAFFLGEKYAPARALLDQGVRVALASDFNPGSSMCFNLPLIATLAITHKKMSLSESLVGITLNGADSLGLESMTGSLEIGKRADFILLDSGQFHMPFYHFGTNYLKKTYSYLDFLHPMAPT